MRGSDIDHVVIGPAGVFTINTKHHERGTVWVASRRLLVNGQRTDHLRNSEHEASRVARLLGVAAPGCPDVTPLVVIVAARRITIRERPARVVVLGSDDLVRWLRARPTVLDMARVAELATAAVDASTWGGHSAPVPDLTAFAELREWVRRARSRRRVWALVGIGAILAMGTVAIAGLELVVRLAASVGH